MALLSRSSRWEHLPNQPWAQYRVGETMSVHKLPRSTSSPRLSRPVVPNLSFVMCRHASAGNAYRPYFWNSQSLLSSGQTWRALSHLEMQWKWNAC